MVARAIEIRIEDNVEKESFVVDSMLSESKSCLCVCCSKDEEGCHIACYLVFVSEHVFNGDVRCNMSE
jgi:hypothetical protein